MSNKRRRCFTIVEKVRIIERLESGVSNKDLCQELGISQSTLSSIYHMEIKRPNKKRFSKRRDI